MQSFDTKESFESKDSEVKEANNDVAESFDRKFESFESKHSEVELFGNGIAESFDRKSERSELKDTKVDGRSKPRTRKQIDAYKRNFNSAKSIEWKINELDIRVQHLQHIVLGMKGFSHSSQL